MAKKTARGALAIFVKTPGVSQLKTRLAKGLGREGADAFYLKSLQLTEELAKTAAKEIQGLTPYWSVAEDSEFENPIWSGLSVIGQGGGGDLGDRLHYVYDHLKSQYDYVLLMGSDSPHLSVERLAESAELLVEERSDFTIGPTEDGGFYIFGGRKAIAKSVWKSIPYSVSNTTEVLLEVMKDLGSFEIHDALFDIDTIEDLERLRQMDCRF